MKSTIKKEEDGTIILTISIPQEKVKKAKEVVVDAMVSQANLPGFRKGKAPKKLVEEKLDTNAVQEEVLKKVLPDAYVEAVKEHNLNPIINPKIHITKLGEEDWEFTATTCEVPEVQLGEYKKAIQDVTVKKKIIIPGKEEEQKEVKFEDIVGPLLQTVQVKIPSILKEGEIDRLLSQLLNEVKSLGLSLDQYLASSGKTPQTLRDEYDKKVENDIKLEFTLQKIAEAEKITVEEKEIEEAIQKAKDEKEKEHLQSNRYLLSSIIRQQKTLDFLRAL